MSQALVNAIRQTLIEHAVVQNGTAHINLTDAVESLMSCAAYLVAGAPAERRAGLLAQIDDELAGAVARIVGRRHPIVGTGVIIDGPPS